MQKVKIDFVDFWAGFDKTNNYFFNLLSKTYTLCIDDDPEILFYSSYGESYLTYKCIRIFYSAENMRPDFTGCDFALTFDYNDDPRHYRLPLYALYIEQLNKMDDLLKLKTKEEAIKIWNSKTKFCCMVVSNGSAKKRIDFFHKVSKCKKVDSGGRFLNNIGEPVKDKLNFIKDYKFVLAFENSSSPGYTTEKILEPMLVDSIPVYWGNKLVAKDFNTSSFLNHTTSATEEAIINEMLAIDKDAERAVQMIMEPKFPENKIPSYIDTENVSAFVSNIINNRNSIDPVANSSKRILHFIKRKGMVLFSLLKMYMKSAWQFKMNKAPIFLK